MHIYLDNNATTMVSSDVSQAMQRFATTFYANPSSMYGVAGEVREAVRDAFDNLYALLNAPETDDIIITSGATESNNQALKSLFQQKKGDKFRVITSNFEHPSIKEPLEFLEQQGAEVIWLPVDSKGLLHPEQVEEALTEDTDLVTIMLANNEVGTILPLAEIVKIVKSKSRALVHSDATQAIGKIPVDVQQLGLDMLSLSAHKFHGPKGVGALYLKQGLKLQPLLHGGEQMGGLRAGTLNSAGIIGMGIAAAEAVACLDCERFEVAKLRDKLESFILSNIPGTSVNGDVTQRVPNTTNISFQDIEGEAMLWDLNEHNIYASTGSACASEDLDSSPILRAMSVDHELAHTAIRFSLSRFNKEAEIDYVIEVLPKVVKRLRAISKG